MEYKITYPKGGSNTMWEPMHITASLKNLKGLSIQGVTCTRDGCRIILFDEHNQEMASYKYFSGPMSGPINSYNVAKDMTETMNLLLELGGSNARIKPIQLEPVMKEIVNKCESRYGNRLPDSEYEALVVFE